MAGESWRRLEGMRDGMTTLAQQATARGALYAGTEHQGLFRSADAGEHWIPWGLAGISIYAIVIDETDGGMWVGTEMGIFKREPYRWLV